VVDFVAYSSAEHNNSDKLGGNELEPDNRKNNGFSSLRHSGDTKSGRAGTGYGSEPDQDNEKGQECQVGKAENVVSSPPAGYTKLLIEDRPGQP